MFSERTNWALAQNRLTLALEEVRATGTNILDLTVSNPTHVGLQYDTQAILQALSSPRALDYDPQPKGLLSAREAIVQYYRDDYGLPDLNPDQIILTTSTSEAYSFVFRLLCNPGDEVLVPKPSYPLFDFLADLQDVKLVPYELIYDHGWQIDFPSLAKAGTERSRALIVVNPNNPTGSCVQGEEVRLLNSFCRLHRLAVIADEVFLDYGLEKPAVSSFAANHDLLTFTLSGLSKISALPQMKVAWIATSGPPNETAMATERLEVIADTYLSMNAPMQWAIPVLLAERKRIQPQLLQRIQSNLAELDRQLASHPSCTRLQVQGGWNVVLRVPVTRSDEELAIAVLREKSVLVHPGHFYDFAADGYLVLSLITPAQEFTAGVSALLSMLTSGIG